MKIEIGESLVYTWLRHVKQCQMVQMNWTPSKLWTLKHQSDLDQIMKAVDLLFPNYAIFGHKTKMPLDQFVAHAEIDVMGSLDLGNKIFAVDVAFHENGLGYGGTVENAARVIKKCLRAAMCIYGYFDKKEAEVIFVSPKIHKKDWPLIEQDVKDLELELNKMGYGFVFKVICDQSTPDFQSEILDPVLGAINKISDTNELFVRSVQLLHMFYKCSSISKLTISDDEGTEGTTDPTDETDMKKLESNNDYLDKLQQAIKNGTLPPKKTPKPLDNQEFKDCLKDLTPINEDKLKPNAQDAYRSSINRHLDDVFIRHGITDSRGNPISIFDCVNLLGLIEVFRDLVQKNTNEAKMALDDTNRAVVNSLRIYIKFMLLKNNIII